MKLGRNKSYEIPATISETIYRHLKGAVVDGTLKPDEKITERKIAQVFNVSPTPVREAFRRLAAEGLLTINARREVTVISATLNEIREIFEVLRINDVQATKKAIKNLSEKDISEIKIMTGKMKVFYEKRDFPSYYGVNLKVHDVIWRSCGNKYLYQTLSNLSQKLFIHKNLVFELTQDPQFFAQSYQDHLELLKALEQRRVKAVHKILNSHWAKGFLGESTKFPQPKEAREEIK